MDLDERQGAGEALIRQLYQRSFIDFTVATTPSFVVEETDLLIAEELEALEGGEFDRLMIFLMPRVGKSEKISKHFPAWYMGRHSSDKVMQISYKLDLAIKFGRNVRDIISTPKYQAIFPGVTLRGDVKGAGTWMVSNPYGLPEGEYYAAGVTGGIAGFGWNLGIIDDPLSEQDVGSEVAKAYVRDWYGPGFYSRQQPERNMAVLMTTRWAGNDLPGYLLSMQESDPLADRWRVIKIPAILDRESAAKLNRYTHLAEFYDQQRNENKGRTLVSVPNGPKEYQEGDSCAPRRWPLNKLLRLRNNMPERMWSALYLQNPVDEKGHILLRKAWRQWMQKELPPCYEIIACYDTAIEEDEEADYSARTTWGLFEHAGVTNVLLLDAWRDRLPPHELLEHMEKHARDASVDRVLIEKRASGSWLIKEGRRRGLPAQAWLPPGGPRSKGKVPRAYGASYVLESGAVWYVDRRWAQLVIDECAEFPFGANDDWADTVTCALLYLRDRWKIELKGIDDREDEDEDKKADFDPIYTKMRVYG